MNDIIKQLQAHRSIRKFKPDPVTDEQLASILASAQAASTSSNIQAYSVVGVRNKGTKRQFAELAGGQKHIEEAPLFLVWCADLNRLQTAVQLHEGDDDRELVQNVETFLLATIDTTLAAQNAAVAAESLGLGIVYIGGIRNDPKRAAELLKLPQFVYPVFGMCLGVPDQEPGIRPRLPVAAIYHEEIYGDEALVSSIKDYDETTKAYYSSRAGGSKDTYWSKEMASRFHKGLLREHLHGFIEGQGYRFK
ncbi:oxygen-insensitive NADPH nitroreductase [Paenibacillus sp. OV219]|uniref:oxygen-insensitive NADPH nitroreductase n=1 Tax=Paenibacillus sp. OV219 TaxID=1884377 RepID=UPI0008CC03F3|nr:oxygen-insensitive NADPH nitroreductase [Paenibacillus sp. OV219]SEN05201.1 FMN reductase (NADPH) [Paenibacillus sp. OV219]